MSSRGTGRGGGKVAMDATVSLLEMQRLGRTARWTLVLGLAALGFGLWSLLVGPPD
jgi:transcription elongation GreA/GreB family factor